MTCPTSCPKCGAIDISRVDDLKTRPVVYICELCLLFFTARGRSSPGPSRRRIRRALVRRWDQLADDLANLADDIRDAPDGTFEEWEKHDAVHGLSQEVWMVMVSDRPRLPRSHQDDPKRAAARRAGRVLRKLRAQFKRMNGEAPGKDDA